MKEEVDTHPCTCTRTTLSTLHCIFCFRCVSHAYWIIEVVRDLLKSQIYFEHLEQHSHFLHSLKLQGALSLHCIHKCILDFFLFHHLDDGLETSITLIYTQIPKTDFEELQLHSFVMRKNVTLLPCLLAGNHISLNMWYKHNYFNSALCGSILNTANGKVNINFVIICLWTLGTYLSHMWGSIKSHKIPLLWSGGCGGRMLHLLLILFCLAFQSLLGWV